MKFNCNIYSIVISFHKSVTTCSKSDYLFVNQQLNYVSFSDKCAPAHTKKIHAKSCKIVPSMIKTILRYLGFKWAFFSFHFLTRADNASFKELAIHPQISARKQITSTDCKSNAAYIHGQEWLLVLKDSGGFHDKIVDWDKFSWLC